MTNRIVCAANSYIHPEDSSLTIICGARHWDKVMHSQVSCFDDELWNNIRASEVQGFIDQRGNFLTREEAFDIAELNGQIIRLCGSEDKRKLYSENLY